MNGQRLYMPRCHVCGILGTGPVPLEKAISLCSIHRQRFKTHSPTWYRIQEEHDTGKEPR